eukprot:1159331-Pelagomonas_calceolata.AAC.7
MALIAAACIKGSERARINKQVLGISESGFLSFWKNGISFTWHAHGLPASFELQTCRLASNIFSFPFLNESAI